MDIKELLGKIKPGNKVDLKTTTVGSIMDDMITGKIEADEAIETLAELAAKAASAVAFILKIARSVEEAEKNQGESSQTQA